MTVAREEDVLKARQQARALAIRLGFWSVEQTFIAIAVAELALNILQYAERGKILLQESEKRGARGIVIVVSDDGPGISDTQLVFNCIKDR